MSNKERKVGIDKVYKVIVLGDPHVGKKELLANSATNSPEETNPITVGASKLKRTIELKHYEVTVNLIFWDIAGHALSRPYFNGADGMLLVFDLTRSNTFININNWYSAAVNFGLSGIPRILIGNKAHLKILRKISLPMVERLCEKINAHYYETSSLTGHNVKEVFEKIAELIYRVKNLDEHEKNEKLIIKPYQGEFIEIPKAASKKASPYKIIDPYWLDALDHRSGFGNPRPIYPKFIKIKIGKKELTEEKKRKRKERAIRYFENENKKIENWEKRVKLIEAMKKSEKIKKEKPFIFIPFTGISKTKEERKSKLRIQK